MSVENPVKLLVNYNVNINYLLTGKGPIFVDNSATEIQDKFCNLVEDVLKKNGLLRQ